MERIVFRGIFKPDSGSAGPFCDAYPEWVPKAKLILRVATGRSSPESGLPKNSLDRKSERKFNANRRVVRACAGAAFELVLFISGYFAKGWSLLGGWPFVLSPFTL